MSQAAARRWDRVSHAPGVLAGLAGAVVGALVASMGPLPIVLNAVTAGGVLLAGISKGMSQGRSMVRSVRSFLGLSDPITGLLRTGSATIEINGRRAIRAEADKALCHGRWMLEHFPKLSALVATGSATVLFDGLPAGRVGDLMSCGAKIKTGSATVLIGGSAAPMVTVEPTWAQGLERMFSRWGTALAGPGVVGAIGGARWLLGWIGGDSSAVESCRWTGIFTWELQSDEVSGPYDAEASKAEVMAELEDRYGGEPARLQAEIDALIASADQDIARAIDMGYYGSARHQQFGQMVSDLTGGQVTPQQAMMMQPFGGDMGPGTGIYAGGLLGRHSMIHDAEGFLAQLDVGPGYGGPLPGCKFSGQSEGLRRELLFPSALELAN